MLSIEFHDRIATIALNDPARRNALGIAMFDALDAALSQVAAMDDVVVLLLRGEGPAFCAGFDLQAAVDDPALMPVLIHRLSAALRTLRRVPQVVIAAAHGSAIAGGCAILSACDLVVVSRSARLGYPVHRLGISPAVTIPTLGQAIGPGPARALLMSGELIDGQAAHRLGLAFAVRENDGAAVAEARAIALRIVSHGRHALRVTKAWINELDGSLDDRRFAPPAEESAVRAADPEARRMLADFWASRRG